MQRTSTKYGEGHTLHLLEEVVAKIPVILRARRGNGQLWLHEQPCAATLVLQHLNAHARMLSAVTEAELAERYLYDGFELEAYVEAGFECVDVLRGRVNHWRQRWKIAALLWRLPAKSQRRISVCLLPNQRRRRHLADRTRRAVMFHARPSRSGSRSRTWKISANIAASPRSASCGTSKSSTLRQGCLFMRQRNPSGGSSLSHAFSWAFVYRTLLAKIDDAGAAGLLPTREDWYREQESFGNRP